MAHRLLLFFLIPVCLGLATKYDTREFFTFGTKTADPCHIGLTIDNPDCFIDQRPWQSNTLLAPSLAASQAHDTTSIFNPAVVLTGKNFGTNANVVMGLSTKAGRCSAVSTANPTPVTATVDNGVLNQAPTDASPGTNIRFSIPDNWRTTIMEFEDEPRAVCVNFGDGYVYSGFNYKVVWPCDTAANAVRERLCPPPNTYNEARTVAIDDREYFNVLNVVAQKDRYQRSLCCASSSGAMGQCINPKKQTCCGSSFSENANQRCCNTATEVVQWNDAPCPCTRGTADQACSLTGEVCCLPTKYSELTSSENFATQVGECYNPNTHQCCDTGKRFDAGSQQCCVINGLQSLNIPCPCGNDDHCIGDYNNKDDDNDFKCCRQTNPEPWEAVHETQNGKATCNIYANYPSGTGAVHAQSCLGTCYSTKYQVCCNGVTCVSRYENCCNSTCCDKYKGTCQRTRRPGALGQWNNNQAYDVEFQACSFIEQMNTVKAFWVFVWPTQLMLGTFVCLAIALGFASHANKYATVKYKFIERCIIAVAVLAALFSIPLFFAPLYKYGTLVVAISILAIISAASRVRWLNAVVVLAHGLLILYLFDPFHANILFNFSTLRTPNGNTDPESMGVLHVTRKMWRKSSEVPVVGSAKHAFIVELKDAVLPSLTTVDSTDYIAEVSYIGQTQLSSRASTDAPSGSRYVAWNEKLSFFGLPKGDLIINIYQLSTSLNRALPKNLWNSIARQVVPNAAGDINVPLQSDLPDVYSFVRLHVQTSYDGASLPTTDWCTDYFDFFKFDPVTRDERIYNPLVPTFGYCSRGYVMALFLFEGGLLLFVLVQFILTIVGLIVRFKDPWTPVHLEARY